MLGVSQIISLPAEVLQQDACIIDEQPAHLVFTVRVPKAAILSNKEVLAAMVDLSGGAMCRPSPEEEGSTKTEGKVALCALFVVLALLVPWGFSRSARADNSVNHAPIHRTAHSNYREI